MMNAKRDVTSDRKKTGIDRVACGIALKADLRTRALFSILLASNLYLSYTLT